MGTDRQHSASDLKLDEAIVVNDMSLYGVEVADLRVGRGEIVALVGRNGSGKSAVSQALTGVLPVATGSVRVLGLDPADDATELKGRIGYLVRDLETMGSLTSRDVLDICAAVRGCTTAYALDLAERLGLDLAWPMGQLSRGELRRLGVVQALMHQPDVIVLDDPTTELDESGRQILAVVLREAAAAGAAVLVTAQSESDAEAYADRIATFSRRPIVIPTPHEPTIDEQPELPLTPAPQLAPAFTARAVQRTCRTAHGRTVLAGSGAGGDRRASVPRCRVQGAGTRQANSSHESWRRCRRTPSDPSARPP